MALGTGELLLLAVIAIMFLGPKEVYKIAHKMGQWMREIQKVSQEFMRELNREADSIERSERDASVAKNIFTTGGTTATPTLAPTPEIGSAAPTVTDDNPASILGAPADAAAPESTSSEIAPTTDSLTFDAPSSTDSFTSSTESSQ